MERAPLLLSLLLWSDRLATGSCWTSPLSPSSSSASFPRTSTPSATPRATESRVVTTTTTTTEEEEDGPSDVRSRRARVRALFREAREAERRGRGAEARASYRAALRLDPRDAHSHLALARSEARDGRASFARDAFARGVAARPDSVHLWQAWGAHEAAAGNDGAAAERFERALELDEANPYACHAYGLLEHRRGRSEEARRLWERGLDGPGASSTAALVCSLGESYALAGRHDDARDLYARHVHRLESGRERTEVYLAAARLEERHYKDVDRAIELLETATQLDTGNGRAKMALVRLQQTNSDGARRRNGGPRDDKGKRLGMKRRLAKLCQEDGNELEDGRLFNAWANLEVKDKRFRKAMDILKTGMKRFPDDETLVQALGKVAERVGDHEAARKHYRASLRLRPSAPALVAYAMLESEHPKDAARTEERVRRLFEEALRIDPRHGPAYNAYGNAELRFGRVDRARAVFRRGLARRDVSDPASVHHGSAMLELSRGHVDRARDLLVDGLRVVDRRDDDRSSAAFLSHTLGTLELQSGRVANARAVFARGLARSDDDDSRLLLGAALCESRSGDDDRARELFERAVRADRRHAHAWQAWGVMEMRAGRRDAARALFECGLKSAPRHGALWQAYAVLESRAGDVDKARNLLAAGVQKCPHHVPLYEAWACLELREENHVEAKTLICEALTRNKKRGTGWFVAAKIEEKLGNDGLARLLLEQGLTHDPNSAELYCALSKLEINRGRIDRARTLLEEGLKRNPLHAPLYHSLAELESLVFNVEGLAKLNQRAAKIFNNNALVPPPASSTAWAAKLRSSATNGDHPTARLPGGVAALAEEIGVAHHHHQSYDHFAGAGDHRSAMSAVDPTSLIGSMTNLDYDDFLVNDDDKDDGASASNEDNDDEKKKETTSSSMSS